MQCILSVSAMHLQIVLEPDSSIYIVSIRFLESFYEEEFYIFKFVAVKKEFKHFYITMKNNERIARKVNKNIINNKKACVCCVNWTILVKGTTGRYDELGCKNVYFHLCLNDLSIYIYIYSALIGWSLQVLTKIGELRHTKEKS